MAFRTPILFLVFNRPQHTARVFERIREIKPQYLFVAADGARSGVVEDFAKCTAVKELIVNGVDWDCELKTLFRDENLGCGKAPAEAITWFFQNVSEGIILEDDCLPDLSFFLFCENMLEKYRDDTRMMMISGFNELGKWQEEHADYFFSQGSIWGWATWARAWAKYDFYLTAYKNMDNRMYIDQLLAVQFPDLARGVKMVDQSVDFWDYQWWFTRVVNNGLSITPSVNLVQNIGFGAEATHTKWILDPRKANRAFNLVFPLRPNDALIRDDEFAKAVDRLNSRVTVTNRVKGWVKRIIGK